MEVKKSGQVRFLSNTIKNKKNSEKQAQIIGKIVVEALESLSNQEKIDEYLRYINVFFRKDDKFEFEKMLG